MEVQLHKPRSSPFPCHPGVSGSSGREEVQCRVYLHTTDVHPTTELVSLRSPGVETRGTTVVVGQKAPSHRGKRWTPKIRAFSPMSWRWLLGSVACALRSLQ
jgi:hypothetical protein